MIKKSILTIALCFSLFGCASQKVTMTETGFLNNYAQLQEDEELKGMKIYRNESVDIKSKYSKVWIMPVEFRLDPSIEDEKYFDEEDREKLREHFQDSLKSKIEEDYETADGAGEDVLLLRTAITDILPNKVYLNLHWSTTLAGAGIGGASIEVELIDSITRERILAFVDAKKGKRLKYTKGLTKWGHTTEVLDMWADIIVDNLEQFE